VAERYSQHAFTPPPGATEIVLIRHGASADAIPGERFDLIDGHGDPPLSPVGQEQARAVADRLAGESLDAIFVTGLTRTVQTAAPLAERLGIEPETITDLREVKLGDWEGGEFRIRAQNRDPIAIQAVAEERWDVVPGAETMETLAERVRRGIDAILERTGPGRRAVAVLHGGIIGEVCRQATDSRPFAFVHSDNCSLSRLVVLPDGRRLLRSFNDTAHLNGSSPG
jgi:2,3-bisphosphoglycerate-dependent phosphoglycerate mutase